MTDAEIMKKAFRKAQDNGYIFPFSENSDSVIDAAFARGGDFWMPTLGFIMFDHDFAQAIFGTKEKWLPYTPSHPHLGENCVSWKWHLRNMVILPPEERIAYLESYSDIFEDAS